jgi:hypothetical protein
MRDGFTRTGFSFAAVLACALVLAAPALARGTHTPSPTPAAEDALTRALARGRLTEAQYALERARSLFRLGAVRAEFGQVTRPDPHAATMILRDLALRLQRLGPAERREAKSLLARPTDSGDPDAYGVPAGDFMESCGTNVCVHWVETTADAADPAWAATTRAVFEDVWQQQVVDMGYRAPLADDDSANQSTTPTFDVYLVELADDGLFGYCTTDDPDTGLANIGGPYDVSAYCVVDNDYANLAYGGLNPVDALGVTAAHEFFHAVQYAYDWTEDVWFLESLSMWMEDQLADNATLGLSYDGINDAVNYLGAGPLAFSASPLDRGDAFDPGDPFKYGSWVFWRFIADELLSADDVRGVLERADGSSVALLAGRDEFSAQALTAYLAGLPTPLSMRTVMSRFVRANRLREYSDEGAEAAYPKPSAAAVYKLGATRTSTGWRSPKLNHLASRIYSFKPSSSASRRGALRVSVGLPRLSTGSNAFLIVYFKSGDIAVRSISLNGSGDGSRKVGFGRGRVSKVDLVLTNASTRFDLSTCWTWVYVYSCGGARPLDDGRTYSFRARIA